MSKFGHGAPGALECGDVPRFVVRDAICPASVEDADPLVGQGAHDRPVSDFLRLLLLPVGAGPAGFEDGLPSGFAVWLSIL